MQLAELDLASGAAIHEGCPHIARSGGGRHARVGRRYQSPPHLLHTIKLLSSNRLDTVETQKRPAHHPVTDAHRPVADQAQTRPSEADEKQVKVAPGHGERQRRPRRR